MILATLKKEVLLLLADRGALVSMFLLPVAFITFFGFMFRGADGDDGDESQESPALAVWVAPGNRWGERVCDAIEKSGMFRIEAGESADAVRRRVADEEVRAALIMGPEFDPLRGQPAEICIDGSGPPQVVQPTLGALNGLIGRTMAGPFAKAADQVTRITPPPGKRQARDPVDSFQVSVPGNAVLFIFFLSMGMAMTFVEERKSGTWRRTLASPVRRGVLLCAKLVPFFVVGLLQMAFFFGLGAAVFGMGIAGSLVGLCVLTAAVVFCAVALGLLLASFGGSERQVAGFGTIIVLVMGLAGGCMFPRMFMPAGMRQLGLGTPHGWALDGYYDLLVREGTTTGDVLPQILALCGFGAVFAIVGLAIFRFER